MKSTRLFDSFTQNLNEIKAQLGIVMYSGESDKDFSSGYLCPVTFDFFDDPHVDDLSEEHVPQKSIEGNVICLTQKKWNVEFSKYDNHVAERSKELAYNRKTGKSRALAYVNGKMKSELTIEIKDGKPNLSFVGGGFKEVNPDFMALLASLGNKEEFKVSMTPKGQLSRNTRLGYLKNAYLLAFATFGYSLIFGRNGNIELFRTVRHQLRNPAEKSMGDLAFVYEMKNESDMEGVYLTKVRDVETISVFFKLTTNGTNRAGVTFPPLHLSSEEVKEWTVNGENVTYYKLNDTDDFGSFEYFSKKDSTKYSIIEFDCIVGYLPKK